MTNVAVASTETAELNAHDNQASVTSTIVEPEPGAVVGSLAAEVDDDEPLPARLALTGLTVLGLLAAAGALLFGGFMLTGFTRRRHVGSGR